MRRTVAELVERLVDLASEDDRLRGTLHDLASALAAATAPPAPGLGPTEATEEAVSDSGKGFEPCESAAPGEPSPGRTSDERPRAESPPGPIEPLHELTFDRKVTPPPASPVAARATDPLVELPAIEARCQLKARGARWASARLQLRVAGVDISERDRAILDEGRRLGGFLWMNSPSFEVPHDPAVLAELVDSFEALAEALRLARLALSSEGEARRELLKPALELVAEAQSALRVAVGRVWSEEDHDQSAAFRWLRGMTEREGIFVGRYMRLTDPADPAEAPRVRRRVAEQEVQARVVLGRSKKKRDLLGKLRWHAGRLDRCDPADENWPKIVAVVDALVNEDRMPPSSVELRDVLLPLHDDLPDRDDDPPGFRLALRELDDYLATREVPAEESTPEPLTAEVAKVAELLRGRSVVLIGGSRRPGSQSLLEAAFGLRGLTWISTREHESIDKFEPFVARPEVALVLLAIRWSSHSFGDVKHFCDRHDKPLVRLPRGYGVNQVAAEILAQVSHRLASGAREEDPGAGG